MSQAFAPSGIYTEDDYYSLPENIRAELIGGQFYHMTAPSRVHQEILMFLADKIANYINSQNGICKVYPAPFAVKLFENNKTIVEPDISVICDPDKYKNAGVHEYWIVNPIKKNVVLYRLEKADFGMDTYAFQDRIKAGIYHDLWIDFKEMDL